VRCVYLANGATLIGFTLSNGSAPGTQCGGLLGESTTACLSNCVIMGNSNRGAGLVTLLNCSLIGNAITGGMGGGGANGCVLTNCLLSDNSSRYEGGGASDCLLSGSIVSNNLAYYYGGGVAGCTLYDCTLTGNSTQNIFGGGGGASSSTLNHCLITNNSAPYADGGGCLGGSLTNCTLINNSARFGGGASRAMLSNCILSGNSAAENGGGAENSTLISCTVTNNGALFGGGVYLCQATNCIIKGNIASAGGGGAYLGTLRSCILLSNVADFGGGASEAVMSRCAILTNSAYSKGGGIANGGLDSCILLGNTSTAGGGAALYDENHCKLNNCTLVGNYATNMGGGAFDGTLNNCIVYYNNSPTDPNLSNVTNVYYCCTAPLPSFGGGNITNVPSFVDLAAGNFDLQTNSLLINAGSNSYVTNNFDFLGRSRISGGVVDIGAYEFQYQSLDAFHAWLQGYGLSTDGSADYLDSDGDGMNNWQEWIAGTIPTNAASVLRIEKTMASSPGASITVVWQSTTNRNYFVQRSMNLSPAAFVTIQTNISGVSGTMTFTDTNPSAGRAYYRIGVHQ